MNDDNSNADTRELTTGPVYIIGFRIMPESSKPDVYTLFLIDADDFGLRDQPAIHAGRLLLFRSPSAAQQVAELAGDDFTRFGSVPGTVAEVCDVADLVYSLASEDEAGSGGAEVLNRLLDVVSATGLPIPPRFKTVLYQLADHLTFDHVLTVFFAQQNVTREEAVDSVAWCLGAALLRGRLVT